DSAARRNHFLAGGTDAGLLERPPSGRAVRDQDDGAPGVVDIWNSLVREYPDYSHIVHAVGRIGLHLPALLQGHAKLADICPQDASPAALVRQIFGAEARQRLG